jgi:7-cyano-7-deazaguanine reductase
MADATSNPLGRAVEYAATYTPSLLHGILRATVRDALEPGIVAAMRGEDLWTGYEFSWLDTQGKPQVAGVRLRVACHSPALVESKSLKLYLNSFAQTRFDTRAEVLRTLDQDLSLAFRAPVLVELLLLSQFGETVTQMPGVSLDDQDIFVDRYTREPSLLLLDKSDTQVHESLFTHLFRSICPVTGQPDWGSVCVEYRGRPMQREGLLKYLVSYRNHPGFHEATMEQIFVDLMQRCEPDDLTVYGRFQRRGGLDINPFRSTREDAAPVYRMARQ